MRDIKPAGNTHKARKLTGLKVDVANVHIPEDEAPAERRPLFANVELAKKHIKKKRVSMHLGRKERMILLALLGVAVLAGALAAFVFLPSATIALTLQTAPLLVDQKLVISSNASAMPNAIPGSPFVQEVSVQGSSPVTSTEFVGAKAKGTVQLINKTFDDQKIKEKSRLITKDGVLFYMTGSATIPAGDSGGVGSVNVQVEAAQAGPKGNITAQQLNFAALDASAQSLVYGQSQNTFAGGTGEEVKVIREIDIEQAKNSAGNQAKLEAEQTAKAQLQQGWVILEESWESKVTEFTPVGKVSDKVVIIPYNAKATARVMAYKEEVLITALQNALKSRLDENYMLFPGPLSYTKSVDAMDWEKGEVIMTARVTHTTIPAISLDTLRDKLAGRKKEEASAYLQGLPGVQFATIDLWPFWVQRIPEIQKRVNISIKSDRDI